MLQTLQTTPSEGNWTVACLKLDKNSEMTIFPKWPSLRGRRLEGKGKGVLGARETRGAREEEGKGGNACQETIVFAIPPTNYVCKITQLWMTSCQISLAAMHLFKSYFTYCFSFVFLKQEIWSEGTIKKSVNAVVRWKKKVATMRGLLHKIQHKSITFLLKVSRWTSQLACGVCRRNSLQTLCWRSNWIQRSKQKNAGSRERRAELQRSAIRLILQSISLLKYGKFLAAL